MGAEARVPAAAADLKVGGPAKEALLETY